MSRILASGNLGNSSYIFDYIFHPDSRAVFASIDVCDFVCCRSRPSTLATGDRHSTDPLLYAGFMAAAILTPQNCVAHCDEEVRSVP